MVEGKGKKPYSCPCRKSWRHVWVSELQLYSLTWMQGGGEWSASGSGRFTTPKTRVHSLDGRVGSRVFVEFWKKGISCSCQDSSPEPSNSDVTAIDVLCDRWHTISAVQRCTYTPIIGTAFCSIVQLWTAMKRVTPGGLTFWRLTAVCDAEIWLHLNSASYSPFLPFWIQTNSRTRAKFKYTEL